MIIYDKEKIKKTNNWNDNTIHILSDFDKTITTSTSRSTWGILSDNELISPEYAEESKKLFETYRPIEMNTDLDKITRSTLMKKWWEESIDLFVKSKLTRQNLKEITKNPNLMEFRKGAKEFLKNMYERQIPVILISAGIGNFIEEFLISNDCNFNNIYIVSNFLKFENEIAVGLDAEVIHSSNKNQIDLPQMIKQKIQNRPNIILLGDNISDYEMAKKEDREEALKIGFLDENVEENLDNYKEKYDIVCTHNTSFNELINEITILKG